MPTGKFEFQGLMDEFCSVTNPEERKRIMLNSIRSFHKFSIGNVVNLLKQRGLNNPGKDFDFKEADFLTTCQICKINFNPKIITNEKMKHFTGIDHWEKFEQLLKNEGIPRKWRFNFIIKTIQTTDFEKDYQNDMANKQEISKSEVKFDFGEKFKNVNKIN